MSVGAQLRALSSCDILTMIPVHVQLLQGSHCSAMGYVRDAHCIRICNYFDREFRCICHVKSIQMLTKACAGPNPQTYQAMDNIYTPVRLFWKTVRPKAMPCCLSMKERVTGCLR